MKIIFDLSSIPKNLTEENAKKINLSSAKCSAIAVRVGIYSIFLQYLSGCTLFFQRMVCHRLKHS
jgi:hypothetical protein